MNNINTPEKETATSIDTIDHQQARLFYLITQYSLHPCIHIAERVVQQLTNLCRHPNIELLPAQHYIYCQSINYWRSRLVKDESERSKNKLH